MSSYRYPFIAREGWWLLAILFVINLLVHFLLPWLLPLPALLLLFVLYLYRDPYREIPSDPLGIVAPVCGIITELDVIDDPHLQCRMQRIRIHMRMWDVWSLRCPTEGKIRRQWFDRSAVDNTSVAVTWVQTDEQDDVLISVLPYQWPHLAHLYLYSGERIGQGQRCGWLCLASIVELLIPETSILCVQPGQRMCSGETVLAHFIHQPTEAASPSGAYVGFPQQQTVSQRRM